MARGVPGDPFPLHWWLLRSAEQDQWLIRVACPVCGAWEGARCLGGKVGDWHGRRYDEAEKEYDRARLRNNRAQERVQEREENQQWDAWIKAQVEAAAWKTADEVSRTCPWCGILFPTVILMEEHEVECE